MKGLLDPPSAKRWASHLYSWVKWKGWRKKEGLMSCFCRSNLQQQRLWLRWDHCNWSSSSGGATDASQRLNNVGLTGFTTKQNDWQDWFNVNGWLTSFTGVFVYVQYCLSQWPDWLVSSQPDKLLTSQSLGLVNNQTDTKPVTDCNQPSTKSGSIGSYSNTANMN